MTLLDMRRLLRLSFQRLLLLDPPATPSESYTNDDSMTGESMPMISTTMAFWSWVNSVLFRHRDFDTRPVAAAAAAGVPLPTTTYDSLSLRATIALACGCMLPALCLGWLIMHSIHHLSTLSILQQNSSNQRPSPFQTSWLTSRFVSTILRLFFALLFIAAMTQTIEVGQYLTHVVLSSSFTPHAPMQREGVYSHVPWPTCTLPIGASTLAAAAAAALSSASTASSLRHFTIATSVVVATVAINELRACTACPSTGVLRSALLPSNSPGGRGVRAMWTCEMKRGGLLSVVQGPLVYRDQATDSEKESASHVAARQGNGYTSDYHYKLMRMDHSIMGGEWIYPSDIKGLSVYHAFVVQSAAWVFLPGSHRKNSSGSTGGKMAMHQKKGRQESEHADDDDRTRSLHIGLGAGTSVKLLQKKGYTTDVVEVHQEVIIAARAFFNISLKQISSSTSDGFMGEYGAGACDDGGGCIIHGNGMDVIEWMLMAESVASHSAAYRKYDIVILDIFSGTKKKGSSDGLESIEFLRKLKLLLNTKRGGVIAVNFFGIKKGELRELVCKLRQVFEMDQETVRIFEEDDGHKGSTLHAKNYIVFASNIPGFQYVDVDEIILSVVDSYEYEKYDILKDLAKREVTVCGLKSGDDDGTVCCLDESISEWMPSSQKGTLVEEWKHVAVDHWVAMRQQFGNSFW